MIRRFFRWLFSPPPTCVELQSCPINHVRKFAVHMPYMRDVRDVIQMAIDFSGIMPSEPWERGSSIVCHAIRTYPAAMPNGWIVVFMYDDISNLKIV